jgi:hypothetical protein
MGERTRTSGSVSIVEIGWRAARLILYLKTHTFKELTVELAIERRTYFVFGDPSGDPCAGVFKIPVLPILPRDVRSFTSTSLVDEDAAENFIDGFSNCIEGFPMCIEGVSKCKDTELTEEGLSKVIDIQLNPAVDCVRVWLSGTVDAVTAAIVSGAIGTEAVGAEMAAWEEAAGATDVEENLSSSTERSTRSSRCTSVKILKSSSFVPAMGNYDVRYVFYKFTMQTPLLSWSTPLKFVISFGSEYSSESTWSPPNF